VARALQLFQASSQLQLAIEHKSLAMHPLTDTCVIPIGGLAGSGKTTIGQLLAKKLGWQFVEGDDLHPPENIDKMHRGTPLEDSDRDPWIAALSERIEQAINDGDQIVVSCSMLKRRHRMELCKLGRQVKLVFLFVGPEELRRRLESRPSHFFPAHLLDSQFKDLEPILASELVISVDGSADPHEIISSIRLSLNL
jgi:gluconokinase